MRDTFLPIEVMSSETLKKKEKKNTHREAAALQRERCLSKDKECSTPKGLE